MNDRAAERDGVLFGVEREAGAIKSQALHVDLEDPGLAHASASGHGREVQSILVAAGTGPSWASVSSTFTSRGTVQARE
jgi:hypothetical protein